MEVADLALVVLGGLITIVGYWIRRYINQQDERTKEAGSEDKTLRQMIEDVDSESLVRDSEIRSEIQGLRQYVDSDFVRQREMEGIKQDISVKFSEMREDIHHQFDRMIEVLKSLR